MEGGDDVTNVDPAEIAKSLLQRFELASSHGDVCRVPSGGNFFCPLGCARVAAVPYCVPFESKEGGAIRPCRVAVHHPQRTPATRATSASSLPSGLGGDGGALTELGRLMADIETAAQAGDYRAVAELNDRADALEATWGPGLGGDIDVFIRTYARDVVGLLPYAIQSLQLYGGGIFNRVVLCFPSTDLTTFQALAEGVGSFLVLAPTETVARGLPIFFDYLHADRWCRGDFVMHLDGDMLFNDGIRRSQLIDPRLNKPHLVVDSFDQFPPDVEFGNRQSMEVVVDGPEVYTLAGRVVFPRAVYAWMRQRLEERHPEGSDLRAAVRRLFGPERGHMDNYAPFGALLFYLHRDAVHVVKPGALRVAFLQLDGKGLQVPRPFFEKPPLHHFMLIPLLFFFALASLVAPRR